MPRLLQGNTMKALLARLPITGGRTSSIIFCCTNIAESKHVTVFVSSTAITANTANDRNACTKSPNCSLYLRVLSIKFRLSFLRIFVIYIEKKMKNEKFCYFIFILFLIFLLDRVYIYSYILLYDLSSYKKKTIQCILATYIYT